MGEPDSKKDRIYTYGDYSTWPEDERWELIDGVAWNMSPAQNRFHQKCLIGFLTQIAPFLEKHPCEVYAAPFDVLLPDSLARQMMKLKPWYSPISLLCAIRASSPRRVVPEHLTGQ